MRKRDDALVEFDEYGAFELVSEELLDRVSAGAASPQGAAEQGEWPYASAAGGSWVNQVCLNRFCQNGTCIEIMCG